MYLQQLVTTALQSVGARLRRDAIVYGSCTVCAVAALALAIWASVLALVPLVGAVYAPLIVAGCLVLVIASVLLSLQYVRSRGRSAAPMPSAAVDTTHRAAQFAQIAMIVEAVMLGYTLSRRTRR